MLQGGRGPRSKSSDKKLLLTLLKRIRQDAGLRQVDLATTLGKHQSYVSKYESGERRLDLIELRQVCQAVGISLVDFARRLERLIS
jgi:transcriptional regulator with XRE-family HTH domain